MASLHIARAVALAEGLRVMQCLADKSAVRVIPDVLGECDIMLLHHAALYCHVEHGNIANAVAVINQYPRRVLAAQVLIFLFSELQTELLILLALVTLLTGLLGKLLVPDLLHSLGNDLVFLIIVIFIVGIGVLTLEQAIEEQLQTYSSAGLLLSLCLTLLLLLQLDRKIAGA